MRLEIQTNSLKDVVRAIKERKPECMVFALPPEEIVIADLKTNASFYIILPKKKAREIQKGKVVVLSLEIPDGEGVAQN